MAGEPFTSADLGPRMVLTYITEQEQSLEVAYGAWRGSVKDPGKRSGLLYYVVAHTSYCEGGLFDERRICVYFGVLYPGI